MKRVKICGITGEQEIEWLNEYKPDFAGFVLFFLKAAGILNWKRRQN